MNVVRIALPGADIIRGKVEEMVLDSVYPSPKIDTTASPMHVGTIYLNWDSTASVAYDTIKLLYSFPHNYDYIPSVFAAYRFDNGSNILQGTLPFQNGALGMITIDADEKNINLKYYSFDLFSSAIIPFNMQIRFYVMAEEGY